MNWGWFQTVPCHPFSGKHLQYISAFPFEHDIPEQFHNELKKAANWEVLPVTISHQDLQSQGNMAFISIAKQTAALAKGVI